MSLEYLETLMLMDICSCGSSPTIARTSDGNLMAVCPKCGKDIIYHKNIYLLIIEWNKTIRSKK